MRKKIAQEMITIQVPARRAKKMESMRKRVIPKKQKIKTNDTKNIFRHINVSFYQLLYNEITSIPGLVLCVIFLWKLKVYYMRERDKKERLRTSVVFSQGFPLPTDTSQKTFMQQFLHSL